MPAAKRAAPTAAGGALKKRPAATDPVTLKLATVRAALLSEGLKAEAGSTLASVVDASLGIPKDQRHHYQESVVQMVGDALSRLDASMAERVEELRVKVDGAGADKAARKEGLLAAEAALEPLKRHVEACSEKLSSCKEEAAQAKTLLKKAVAKNKETEAECKTIAQHRAKYDGALKELALLKESPISAASKKVMSGLIELGKGLGIDPTLLATLPKVLKIASEERSTFDNTTIAHYEGAVTEKIAKIEVSAKEASEEHEVAASAAEDAQRALTKAEEVVQEAQAALKASRDAEKAGEKAIVDAQKRVQKWLWDQKEIMDDYDNTRIKLDDLRKGAVNAFAELKETTEASMQAGHKQQDATEAAVAAEVASEVQQAEFAEQPLDDPVPVTA